MSRISIYVGVVALSLTLALASLVPHTARAEDSQETSEAQEKALADAISAVGNDEAPDTETDDTPSDAPDENTAATDTPTDVTPTSPEEKSPDPEDAETTGQPDGSDENDNSHAITTTKPNRDIKITIFSTTPPHH